MPGIVIDQEEKGNIKHDNDQQLQGTLSQSVSMPERKNTQGKCDGHRYPEGRVTCRKIYEIIIENFDMNCKDP